MAINNYLQREDLRNQFINELRNSNRPSAPAKTGGRPTSEILAEKFIPAWRSAITTFASTNGLPSADDTPLPVPTPFDNGIVPATQQGSASWWEAAPDDLSRDDAKKQLIQSIKTWRSEHPEVAKGSVFENTSDSEISTILDEWANNKTRQYLGEEYDLYDSEKITGLENKRFNDEIRRIKSNGFFTHDDDFKKEVEAYRDKTYPNSKGNLSANKSAKEAILGKIERGEYTTRDAAFSGMSDYIKNIRNNSTSEEPEEQEEDEYVTITFEPGDTFGQKIIDSGLATEHGLWGEDGDAAYYARQLDIPDASVINEGDTFRIKKRK